MNKLPILLVPIMPFVWFTYRILSLTIYSILAFMICCIDDNKVRILFNLNKGAVALKNDL